MTSPKVSVLIPTYNYARYLPEAIESVLEQDFQDFELLLSDDCSADASREVIAAYAAKDRRIRSQIHPVRLGMVQNWNWCLSEARGEYVKFLFGDDKLASRQALTKLVALLETNVSATLAASPRFIVGPDSEILEIWDEFAKPGLHKGTEVIARCLDESRNLIGEPSVVLFRKRDAVRDFNLRYRQIVDLDMWFSLLETGDFAYVREPLCSFRKHAEQQTEANRTDDIGEREALRLFVEYHARPYLRSRGFHRRLFTRVYHLRKRRKRDAHVPEDVLAIGQDLEAQMGRFWYAVYWSRHKIFGPIERLPGWFARRRRRAARSLRPVGAGQIAGEELSPSPSIGLPPVQGTQTGRPGAHSHPERGESGLHEV